MDFSAFLVPHMSEEKKKVGLRSVDESQAAERTGPEVKPKTRLEVPDSLRPVDESQTAERTGPEVKPETRLEVPDKKKLRIRSAEADFSELNPEDFNVDMEDEWADAGGSDGSKRIPLGWVLVTVVIFVSAVIWALVQVRQSEKRSEELKLETQTAVEEEEQEEIEVRQMIAMIEEVAEKFHAAEAIEEMMPLVRHSSRVKPLMEDHYSRHPLKADAVTSAAGLEPVTIGNHGGFWIVQTMHDSGEKRPLLVEMTSEGEARVDWESHVRYQPMDWDDFVAARPEGYTGDFRVYAEKDNFFSHEFSNSEKYDCFRLSTLKSDKVLFGYILSVSPDAEQMNEIIDQNQGRKAPMILRLHVPENVRSRSGVLIEELVSQRWMFLESPDGDK